MDWVEGEGLFGNTAQRHPAVAVASILWIESADIEVVIVSRRV